MSGLPPPPVFAFPFVRAGLLTLSHDAMDFLTKLWNWATLGIEQPFYSFTPGVPTNGQVLGAWLMIGNETFAAGLVGSVGKVQIAPTADATLLITVNGATIGSASVLAGQLVMTFQMSLDYIAAAYDELQLVAPASADATMAGIYATLLAQLA